MSKKHHDDEVVPVLFRVWKPRPEHGEPGRDVIAIFPTIPTDHMGYKCEMFEHVGQHGGGDPAGVIRMTRPAKPSEYRDLKHELEAAPYRYKLRVVERMSSEMQAECRRQARRVRESPGARGGGGARAASPTKIRSDVKKLATDAKRLAKDLGNSGLACDLKKGADRLVKQLQKAVR